MPLKGPQLHKTIEVTMCQVDFHEVLQAGDTIEGTIIT
jgi:hypothetical protein